MCCKTEFMAPNYILFNIEAYFFLSTPCCHPVLMFWFCPAHSNILGRLHKIPNDANETRDCNFYLLLCCCFVFPTQQDKGEEASGSNNPAPLNQPPPPSRPPHRWHVIARHWLRQTRRRTSGVLPVTTRTSRNILFLHTKSKMQHTSSASLLQTLI